VGVTSYFEATEEGFWWPDDEEWKQIGSRIKQAHGFVNCVGLIEGTLFPLAFAPTLNSEDYFTWKGNYAIKVLFVCDDTVKITLVEMGWLGSVQVNQVWSNSDVYLSIGILGNYGYGLCF